VTLSLSRSWRLGEPVCGLFDFMKSLASSNTLALVLYAFISVTATQAVAQPQPGSDNDAPSAENLMRHVYVLADDSMRGRGTQSDGYDMAARYVAETFRQHGVIPELVRSDSNIERYFHQFGFEVEASDGRRFPMESYNVVGSVPGTNPELSSEQVVVGAHLDHMGIVDGEILNGASDNASGVAVMLEVARLISRSPPSRTVVFVAFGAEEWGLLGSIEFVESIADNKLNVVAHVNIDDVGHLRTGPIGRPLVAVLHERSLCLELYNLVRAHGDRHGVAITDQYRDDVFTRSDHYSFYQAGIPVVDFGSGGEHEWLHTPQDDPEEMDGAQLQKVATVVYETVRTFSEEIDRCGSR